jgi:hypothetical protein
MAAATAINYHGRRFRPVSNSSSGQVNQQTMFLYQQPFGDALLTATYMGGGIRLGSMTGLVDETTGALRFHYQHVTDAGELRSGYCESTPELLSDGRLRLHERWKWTDGPAGESVVEEVAPAVTNAQSETAVYGDGDT